MKNYFSSLIFFFFFVFSFFWFVSATDLLDIAFQASKQADHVISMGETKDAVGNEIFRGGTQVNAKVGLINQCYRPIPNVDSVTCKDRGWFSALGQNNQFVCVNPKAIDGVSDETICQQKWWLRTKIKGLDTNKQPSYIVRMTKLFLRLCVWLAVTMLMIIGVQVVIDGMGSGEIKSHVKNIWYVVAWLLLALSALGIIELLQSIGRSSLWETGIL